MGKNLRWVLAAGWVASTLYLLFLQIKLAFPFYAFFALFRAELWLCVFANAFLTIALAFTLLRRQFTSRTLLLLTAMVSISLAMGMSFYGNAPIRSGFAYSENKLTECLSNGEAGDICGIYRIKDIRRTAEYTIIFTSGDQNTYDPCGFIKFSDSAQIPNGDSTELYEAGFYSLGSGWYVFYSHYNSIKMGWS